MLMLFIGVVTTLTILIGRPIRLLRFLVIIKCLSKHLKWRGSSFLTIASSEPEFVADLKESGEVYALVVKALVMEERSSEFSA